MPLFSKYGPIYSAKELMFMRSCYFKASTLLEVQGVHYSRRELAERIVLFYDAGIRDADKIVTYSCGLIKRKVGFEREAFLAKNKQLVLQL
ncbi:hypothetical protein BG46_25210 [Brucella anthropi]|uniref:hypothetical protein n=1 Tax=Brucella anthropi TaxID=529 RepID=UPI00044AB6D5|nr:hypothetical protein [Brucella anthropi]EXL04295.1 hypothetical protein BG46_25210 [Brucella anthropi]